MVEQQQQQQLDKEKLKLLQEELSLASMMTGVDPDGKTSGTLERILRWDWNQEATKDEDSLPAQMRRMVTEQYFETIEGDAKKSYMLEKLMDKSFVYQDESTEITLVRSNTHVYIYMCVPASFWLVFLPSLSLSLSLSCVKVAMVSARAAVMNSNGDHQDDDASNVVDDELNVSEEGCLQGGGEEDDTKNSKLSVAAQVEEQ